MIDNASKEEGARRIIGEKVFALLQSSHRILKSLHLDNRDAQAMYSVALCCRILELSEPTLVLFRAEKDAAVPILVRTIYEANVDLANLTRDRKYAKVMYANHLAQRRKVMNFAAENPDSPYHRMLATADQFNSRSSQVKEELKGLKSEEVEEISIFEKFEIAETTPEYRSVYSLLSGETHNDIRVLENRHIYEDTSGLHVSLFKVPLLADSIPEMTLLAEVLARLPEKLQRVSGVSIEGADLAGVATAYDEALAVLQQFVREDPKADDLAH